ncbi:hypothetical protein OL239_04300 [Arthrobacter sp. ATA002]|uniref:hypothetical protein n=1 Tax=Arthrobacter sp. ATA002 TaxID=2991715 RepID=UPI0022A7B92B|nr:hypothetical protein [Arthrobacter sp. ATA002]WAP52484.1 hypothetical protein OL239_04300 [Arthrobacter sp. ATA002]
MLRYRESMIDALLRRPAGAGEFFADAVRLLCLFSLAAAFLWYGPVDVALFLLVLMGTLISRSLEISRRFDGIYGLTLLTAAWSSVLDLYARVGWWDLPVHFAATGVIAVMAYLLLARLNAVPSPVSVPGAVQRITVPILVLALGLAVSVLWELGEWWGNAFVDESINVGYQDTMGDLAAGGLGALLAGLGLGLASRAPVRPSQTADRPGMQKGTAGRTASAGGAS